MPLLIDALAVAAAAAVASLVASGIGARVLIPAVVVGLLAQPVLGMLLGLYRGRAELASFEEVLLLVAAVAGSVILVSADFVTVLTPAKVVAGAAITGSGALALTLGARILWRLRAESRLRDRAAAGRPTLVYGAGEGGHSAVRSLLRNPGSTLHPVGFLDDDPSRRNRRLLGVPVLGGGADVIEVARRTGAEVLLVAIPSASGALLGSLQAPCREAALQLKVLPSVQELVTGQAKVGDIRDVSISDVLGRPPSVMDPGEMASYLQGKRVLVTGAGGSIGSELCRVLSRFEPAQVLMLDRDESALHAVQLSIEGRALLDSPSIILADIRDTEAMLAIMEQHRPHIVFHAAALKHLPLLERFPGEAVKSNVWGTLSVLAASVGVERLVNISTDKAANPVSVLGWSKRVAERLVAHGRPGTTCVSVRFGNVLGSRGSVLHTFAAQAQAGGPITVTHPETTRYFMTVTEAVHLVIAAGGIGRNGEALVLDMGEPANILDVAKRVSADNPVPIQFTGLRQGEKLHEELFGTGEVDERPIHPLISHVGVPPLDPVAAYALDAWAPAEEVLGDLVRLADEVGDGTEIQTADPARTSPAALPGPRSAHGSEVDQEVRSPAVEV